MSDSDSGSDTDTDSDSDKVIGVGSTGFADFDRLSLLFRRTRALLHAQLATGDLPDGGTELLANETLPHIEDVEAGFRSWLRASEGQLLELRQLVVQGGGLGLSGARDVGEARAALIEAMQARAGAGGERELAPPPNSRMAALEHARLVFAILPRTPPEEIHFPAPRRSYADIAAPRSPGELAVRIEELERMLWSVATGRVDRPGLFADPAYRRTYGFFDAAEHLTGGLHLGG